MSKFYCIVVLLSAALLSLSCSKDGVESQTPITEGEECTLNVTLNGFILTESQSAKPVVRGGTDITLATSVVNRLAVALYSSGKLVEEVKQYSTDADYGTISFKVVPGNYKIVAVAYNDKDNQQIPSFTNMSQYNLPYEGKTNDTFYGTQDITVSNTIETTQVNMSRAIACFVLTSTNTVPDEVRMMQMIFRKGSKADLNPITGLSLTDDGYVWSSTVSEAKRTENPVSWTAYTLLATDEETMNITVNGINELGETIYTHQFNNVTLKRNRKLTATGMFFSYNYSASFILNTDWLEGTEMTY